MVATFLEETSSSGSSDGPFTQVASPSLSMLSPALCLPQSRRRPLPQLAALKGPVGAIVSGTVGTSPSSAV